MPRRARLKLAGFPLHVIQRGNNKSACFLNDGDYSHFLRLLDELSKLFGCAIHSYVLMTNHVHLLLTPERLDSASFLMKHLGQRYVQYINRRYARTGSLWEGRFRSSIVDSEAYLMRCHRYIELNPIRAGMVRHPAEYEWSSYRTNALGYPSMIVVPHTQYMALANTDEARRLCYSELVEGALSADELQEIRAAANGGFALGRPGFVDQIERSLGRPAVARSAGRPRRK